MIAEMVEIKKLSEVCDFQNGFAFKSKTFKDSGTAVIRISNIQDQQIDLDKIVFVDEQDYKEDLSRYKVSQGDLLIAMSGATTGKLGISQTEQEFLLNQRVGKFMPLKGLDKYYLYYFLSTQVEESLRIAAGAAQPNLSTQQIKDFEIPIPPLPEQERIVAKLDTAFAAIDAAKANTERNLQNAKELFQSKLNEVFSQQLTAGSTSSPTVPAPAVPEPVEGIEGMGDGWVEKKLGDVADLLNGYAFKSKEFVGSGVRLLRNTNVFHGNVDWENTAHYPNDALQEFSRFELFEGDIVLSLDRPIISTGLKLARVRKQDVPSLLLQRVLCIRPQGISADYVFHWMDSPLFISKIDPGKSLGVPHISLKEVSQIELPIPSLDKQTQIVGVLDEMKEQSTQIQTNYTQKLTELEDLKKSLLERAFKGEI